MDKTKLAKLDEAYNAIATADSASIENLLYEEFSDLAVEAWPEIKAALAKVPTGEYVSRETWLPIEKAPRDGTKILSFEKGRWLRVVRWREGWTGWFSVPGDYPSEPTHWVPLPDLPSDISPQTTNFPKDKP